MFYLCADICLLVRRFLPIGSFPIAYWFVFDYTYLTATIVPFVVFCHSGVYLRQSVAAGGSSHGELKGLRDGVRGVNIHNILSPIPVLPSRRNVLFVC